MKSPTLTPEALAAQAPGFYFEPGHLERRSFKLDFVIKIHPAAEFDAVVETLGTRKVALLAADLRHPVTFEPLFTAGELAALLPHPLLNELLEAWFRAQTGEEIPPELLKSGGAWGGSSPDC